MSVYHSKDARVYYSYLELSRGRLTQLDLDSGVGEHDTTTVGDSVESMVSNQVFGGTARIAGFFEQSSTTPLETLLAAGRVTSTPLTDYPNGATLGAPAWGVYGITNGRVISAAAKGLILLQAGMRADGGVKQGICVHPARQERVWKAATAYSLTHTVNPGNGHYYVVTTAGTSDAGEPTWPTSSAATVTDGTVVWTESGTTIIDRGAATTGPWSYHSHITQYSGTGAATGRDSLMHSSNGTAFSELTGVAITGRTGTQVTGTGTVNRYVRSDLTQTGGTLLQSATYNSALFAS